MRSKQLAARHTTAATRQTPSLQQQTVHHHLVHMHPLLLWSQLQLQGLYWCLGQPKLQVLLWLQSELTPSYKQPLQG
jgi:hypothetical protein